MKRGLGRGPKTLQSSFLAQLRAGLQPHMGAQRPGLGCLYAHTLGPPNCFPRRDPACKKILVTSFLRSREDNLQEGGAQGAAGQGQCVAGTFCGQGAAGPGILGEMASFMPALSAL